MIVFSVSPLLEGKFRYALIEVWSSSEDHFSSDSSTKMEGELAALMDMFHAVKRAGRSATLTLSTNSGKATQVKLAIELDDALLPPSTSSTSASAPAASTPATGSRHHRGPAKKAKARARAAKHRAAQAAAASPTDPGGDEGAPPSQVLPPAQGLLQPKPSASPAPTRKLVTKLPTSEYLCNISSAQISLYLLALFVVYFPHCYQRNSVTSMKYIHQKYMFSNQAYLCIWISIGHLYLVLRASCTQGTRPQTG